MDSRYQISDEVMLDISVAEPLRWSPASLSTTDTLEAPASWLELLDRCSGGGQVMGWLRW